MVLLYHGRVNGFALASTTAGPIAQRIVIRMIKLILVSRITHLCEPRRASGRTSSPVLL